MAIEIDGISGTGELQQKLDSAYGYEAAGKLDEALQLCAEIIDAAPDFADVYNLQGVIYEQLGRNQEAVELYARAIKLDPDFKEAKENLAELEAEVELEKEKEVHKQDAIYVAKWGALAFGLTFGVLRIFDLLYFVITADMQQPLLWWYRVGLNWFYTGLTILLVGLATAVTASAAGKKRIPFAVAGGLGFTIAQWLGRTLFYTLMPSTFFHLYSWSLYFMNTIADMMIGAVFGAILGVATKDKRQVFWLTLAGAVGFALMNVSRWFFGSYAYRSSLDSLRSSLGLLFGSQNVTYAIYDIPSLVVKIILAAIFGALMGGVLGWFSGEEIVDEEEDVLVEQSDLLT